MAQKREDFIKEHLSIPRYFELMIFKEMNGYYDGSNMDFDIRPVVRCPLHNESTGSFRYYSETDSFYCWGCGKGGDVINLHKQYMLLNHNISLSYEKLIAELYEMAKEGDSQVGRYKKLGEIGSEEEEVKEINKAMELLRFNIEVNRYLAYIKGHYKGEKLAKAMQILYNYRDSVYGQLIPVEESLKGMREELLSL